MENRIRTNLKRVSNVPVRDRDQYFPEDFDRDMDYQDGKRGDVIQTLLAAVPAILKNTGVISVIDSETIAFTEALGWFLDSKGIVRDIIIDAEAGIDPTITTDGTYYVKANYVEADYGPQRLKVYDPTSYYPQTQDSWALTIDKTAPTADELCLGSFIVNGGNITAADAVGRTPNARFSTTQIELEDASVKFEHLDSSVLGALGNKVTQFRGPYAQIFDPSEFPPNGEHGKLFRVNTQMVTAAGASQSRNVQEQFYPLSRVDDKQDSDVTGSYSTIANTLSEASSDKVSFVPTTGLLFAANHNRIGLYIKNPGSGYTHLRIVLHDSSHNALNSVDIPIADIVAVGANAWIYADIPYTVTPGSTYHYHAYSFGFTSGTTCSIAKSASNEWAFREMYKPTSGKYGSGSQPDVVTIVDGAGTPVVADNASTADDIVTPGDGFAAETAVDVMAVDFSDNSVWQAWSYNNFIGIDLATGRIKLPNGYDIADYFFEGNIASDINDIDARAILRNGSEQSVEDYLDELAATIQALITDSPLWTESVVAPSARAAAQYSRRVSSKIIFNSNVATSGNSYATWAEVMTAVAENTSGQVDIFIGSNPLGWNQAVTIPAGTYNLSKCHLRNFPGANLTEVYFADGTTLSELPYKVTGLSLHNQNTSAALYTQTGGEKHIALEGASLGTSFNNPTSFIKLNSSARLHILATAGEQDSAAIFKSANDAYYEPVDVSSGCELYVNIQDFNNSASALLNRNNIFRGAGLVVINSYVLIPGGYSGINVNFSGTLTYNTIAEDRVNELIDDAMAGIATSYLSNTDFESSVTGWSTYADTAGTSPVDGTGGSPNVTFTRSTSSPLRGAASALITKDAANRQGQGVGATFQIQSADQGRVIQISFDYKLNSGTFNAGTMSADSDLTVWVYDVTNTTLIPLTDKKLYASSTTVSSKYVGSFQAPTNSTQYRLILHVGSTNASAWELKIDEVAVLPQRIISAAAVSDWQAFPSVAAGTLITGVTSNPTYGTTALNVAYWRRVGDSMEIMWNFRQTAAGSAGSGTYLFNVPLGLQIDTTKLSASTSFLQTYVGDFDMRAPGSGVHGKGKVSVYSATQLAVGAFHLSASVQAASVWASGYLGFADFTDIEYAMRIKIPIAGWGSSLQAALTGDDGRVIAAKYTGTASATSSTSAPIQWNTKQFDTHNAVTTGSSWGYKVPISAVYRVAVSFSGGNGVSVYAAIYVNGVNKGEITNESALQEIISGSGEVFCNAGDVIDVRCLNSNTINARSNSSISISKIGGNAVALGFNPTFGRWFTWTPTFTGFGTVTGINARSKRIGEDLHFEITFTAGSTTATEARVSLGYEGVDGIVTSAADYPTLAVAGDVLSSTNDRTYYALIEASKSYITFGMAGGPSSSVSGLNKQNANGIISAAAVVSIKGSVRIAGW